MFRRSLLGLVPLVLVAAGCVEEYGLDHGLQSFEVKLVTLGGGAPKTGSAEDRLPFVSGKPCMGNADCETGHACVDGECSMRFFVDINAIGRDGRPYPFTGMVHLDVTPGRVAPSFAYTLVEDGIARDVPVYINRTLGISHLWAEEDGFIPRVEKYGQCNDGEDNDGNGLVDLADPGCQSIDDDQEEAPTMASGTSQPLYFANPRLRDIQLTSKLHTSPLQGQQVKVTDGRLVVTNVIANGFYLSDLDDHEKGRYFDALFVYTHSKPAHIEWGDVLCEVSGAVKEHVGMTQLEFPSYEDVYEYNESCNAHTPGIDTSITPPPPLDLTGVLLDEVSLSPAPTTGQQCTSKPKTDAYLANVYVNSKKLESFESNVVQLRNVAVSTRFVACDRNHNGLIDDDDEKCCRNECQVDPLCTDLEGFFEYSQWAGVVDGKKKVYASTALAEKFLPIRMDYLGQPDKNGVCTTLTTEKGFLEYQCPERVLASMTGSLRHIYLCGDNWDESECDLQFWVIDPRFDGDIKLDPTRDDDGDGFTGAQGDCDDNNVHVSPEAKETPGNGLDDDCDGSIDES